MTRFHAAVLLAGQLACVAGIASPARGEDKFEAGDPLAAIDGSPIYLGELNLILTERLRVRDLDSVDLQVQQATAALLVRRHLAMKSLRQQGGEALESIIRHQVEAFADEARRRGSSLEQQAKEKLANEKSLIADIAWRAAWSQYLKSRLTEANLRRYFELQRDRYAGHRWEVSQIFVKMEMRDEASVKAAEQDIAALVGELRSSDSPADAFADAARLHSDSASAGEGGKVGWVEQAGDLPGSLMDAVRAAEPGSISGPIRSPLGLHLIFVHRYEPGKLSFDDLTDHAQLRRDAANALFEALVAQQRDAKVTWFIAALRPPQSVSIVP